MLPFLLVTRQRWQGTREVSVANGSWRDEQGQHDASLFRRDLHKVMAGSRGITSRELATEVGITFQAVSTYFLHGGDPERADSIEQAIERISERRGLSPERVLFPTSGLWPDGLPDVRDLSPEAGYRNELRVRDLMKAPGRDL